MALIGKSWVGSKAHGKRMRWGTLRLWLHEVNQNPSRPDPHRGRWNKTQVRPREVEVVHKRPPFDMGTSLSCSIFMKYTSLHSYQFHLILWDSS